MAFTRIRLAVAVAATLAWTLSGPPPATADPFDQAVSTSFEGFNTQVGVPFSIGTSPERATFSGDAFASFLGITDLYRSGSKAWMVQGGGTGEISFETNAAVVEFFAKAGVFATGDTVITAFDDGGAVVGSPVTLSGGAREFTLVAFTGSIDRITVENFAQTGNSGLNGIDDFGFTPIMPGVEGDYNDDGMVDAADYTLWRDNLGGDGSALANRGSGIAGPVGADDYAVWKANFGQSAASLRAGSSPTPSAVPEPASAVLLLALSFTLAYRRRGCRR